MVHIIGSGEDRHEALWRSLRVDAQVLKDITIRLSEIVAASFREDAQEQQGRIGAHIVSTRPTDSEIKRRLDICKRWFGVLRNDYGYSFPRIFDTLPHALRADLDGKPFNPSTRATWAPDAEVSR